MPRTKQNKKPYRTESDPKLIEWPADFDSSKHQPLTLEDFEAEDVFWLHRAEVYERKAAQARREAELFQQFGGGEQRKLAAKAARMADQLAQLRARLEADGIDPDELATMLS